MTASILRIVLTIVIGAAALPVAGCVDGAAPSLLDRDRVLAVRASPAHLAPGQVAPLDVLVGRADGGIAVIPPDRVEVEGDGAAATEQMLAATEEGWTVSCPPEEVLAELRAAQGLSPDDPLPVPLAIQVQVGDELLTATKWVHLGSQGGNPVIDGISLAGAAPASGGTVSIRAGEEIEIAAAVTEVSGEPSFAWYSSAGEIELYRSERATLVADPPGEGLLAVVVRDDRGGVSWVWLEVRVE